MRLQPFDRQRVGQRKAEPQAGQAKELAEGAQHDDAALVDIAGKAFGARADIHEGFVDDQQPALGAQRPGKLKQSFALDDAPVRIVGIDDDGEVGVGQSLEVVDLRRRMAGDRRCPRMFGIGRPEHQRLAGAHQRKRRAATVSACLAPPPHSPPTGAP